MGSKTPIALFLGLILVLSALAVIPIAPASAGTTGTIRVSSERFYGADIDLDDDNDSEAGEAVLQITISDPDIAGASATMPSVKANGVALTLYQTVGGSWVCWIYNSNVEQRIPASMPPQDPTVAGLEPDIDANNDGVADQNQANVVNGISLTSGDTVKIEYFDTDPVTTVSVTVTYAPTDATISLDRTEYPLNSVVRVTVEDVDLNFDPTTADTIAAKDTDDGTVLGTAQTVGGVDWSSTTDITDTNEKYSLAFKETGGTTGVFKTSFDMSGAAFGEALLDIITVKYNDDGTTRSVSATVKTSTGVLEVDKTEAVISDKVTVTLRDPDLDTDSASKQTTSSAYGSALTVQRLKYVDADGGDDWDTGEAIVWDADNDNAYDTDEPVAYGATPAAGTAIENNNDVRFIDVDGDNTWDTTEPIINDTDKDGTFDEGELIIVNVPSSNVLVSSESDTAGIIIQLKETGDNTGVFTKDFGFSFTASSAANRTILVAAPQDVTVTYGDATTATGAYTTHARTVAFKTHTGSIELDRDTYGPNMVAKVTITDPDLNESAATRDRVDQATGTVQVASATAGDTRNVTVLETDVNTGVFEGNFKFSTSAGAAGDIPTLLVNSGGDTITASYNDPRDETGAAKTVTDKAVYGTNTGSIAFAKASYATSQKVKIILTDPDLNLDPYNKEYVRVQYNMAVANKWNLRIDPAGVNVNPAGGYDSAPVFLYSSSWTTGWPTAATGTLFSLKETGISTGEFVYTTTQDIGTLSGGSIKIGDTLYIKYIDAFNNVGQAQTVTGSAIVASNTGILTLDPETIKVGEKLLITVEDPDYNDDWDAKDTIPAAQISVTTGRGDSETTTMTLTETGKDTGIFQRKVDVAKAAPSADDETIQVRKGDTITVKYTDPLAAAGTTNVKVSKAAKVYTTDGTVEFDKDVYSPVGKVKITVTDPDMNEDSLSPDTVGTAGSPRVRVYSTTDPAGINVVPTETGADTGVFTVTVSLKTTGTSSTAAKELLVSNGDSLSVTYTEESDAAGTADVLRMDTATVKYTDASMTFDKTTYTMDESAKIILTEPDANTSPGLKNTVTVTVYSDSDPAGISASLVETDINTGVFEGTITFTTGASSGTVLKTSDGETIVAVYTDTTPAEAPTVASKKVTATATIGVAVPVLPITAGAPSMTDPTTGEVVTPMAGESVMVSTELENTAATDQTMLYIVQIKDATGKVVYMSYISGTVPAGRAFTFGVQWTPAAAGDYTVEVFAWKSWAEPTPLSESVSQAVTVS